MELFRIATLPKLLFSGRSEISISLQVLSPTDENIFVGVLATNVFPSAEEISLAHAGSCDTSVQVLPSSILKICAQFSARRVPSAFRKNLEKHGCCLVQL